MRVAASTVTGVVAPGTFSVVCQTRRAPAPPYQPNRNASTRTGPLKVRTCRASDAPGSTEAGTV
ncbi:MAG: hypothetical protein NVSMB32_18970 [Actinomycetota bacterium]